MVTLEKFLEAGVHFGHKVNRWNPRMAPYIFGERKGIHIIDVVQSLQYLEEAVQFLHAWKKNKATQGVLLVGTKKQARVLVQVTAEKLRQHGFSAHYVNHKWLGGLLTNWSTMKLCIDRLNFLDKILNDKLINREELGLNSVEESKFNTNLIGQSIPQPDSSGIIGLHMHHPDQNSPIIPKKERASLTKEYDKLNLFFGGMKQMIEKPSLVIILGQDTEINAVRECYKLAQQNRASEILLASKGMSYGNGFANLNQPTRDASQRNIGVGYRVTDQDSSIGASGRIRPGKSQDINSQKTRGPQLRTITLLDTNCDPSLADIFIPANDDSTKSLELILEKLTESLIEKT